MSEQATELTQEETAPARAAAFWAWVQADMAIGDAWFRRAGLARVAGNWDLAEELTDRGEAVYDRLESLWDSRLERQAGEVGK